MNHRNKRRRSHMNRHKEPGKPVAPLQEGVHAFDLSKLLITDIMSVKLDSSDEQIIIEASLPVHGGESTTTYEETISLSDQDIPSYLQKAALGMFEAALRAMRERVFTNRESPCETCTGACCGREFERVQVTEEDLDMMRAVGINVDRHIEMYAEKIFTGHVGQIIQVPWGDEEDDETACPFLKKDGCSIYENRPRVCREFSAWDCEVYDRDPDKVSGRVHLRVRS